MRQIFTINAKQVVISESHPEGTYTNVQGYPMDIDSRNYEATEENPNGSEELALIVAKDEYYHRVKELAVANNANRVMWTVTLVRADGQTIEKTTKGTFPDMTPKPEPEPEEPEEEPAE